MFGLCFLLLVFLGGCVFAGSTKDLKPVCFWGRFDIFDFVFLDEMGVEAGRDILLEFPSSSVHKCRFLLCAGIFL